MNQLLTDIKCVLTALVIILALAAAAGALIYVVPVPETVMGPASAGILVIGALAGGWTAGKAAGTRGMLQGLRVSILLFFCMIALTLLFSASPLKTGRVISALLLVLPSGAIGGIIGVGSSG
jgi:putative membrane protein (TIGR04086 family)